MRSTIAVTVLLLFQVLCSLQVEALSVVNLVRFWVAVIVLLVLPSLDLTADNGRLDIKCHPKTDDAVTQECLSRYSAETRSFISPNFLVIASLVFVLWNTIIFYSENQLPQIQRMTDYRKKEALRLAFWKKFFRHVCCEAVVIAVSLAYLCYTPKISTFYRRLNDVTFSIEQHWDNPIIVVIGGMGVIWVLCMWTICDAIYNKEKITKDLVNSTTGNKEGVTQTPKVTMNRKEERKEKGGLMQKVSRPWNATFEAETLKILATDKERSTCVSRGNVCIRKERFPSQAHSISSRNLLGEYKSKEIRDRVGFQEEEERQGRQEII